MRLRKALGQYATGIAVATTMDISGNPHGLTINSFNSVSMGPPLVLWSLGRKSHQLEAFSQSGCYAINILSAEQKDLSVRFSSFMEDRFADLDWEKGKTGSPVFSGLSAKLECETVEILDGGDHIILLGRVVSAEFSDLEPLVYYNGSYRRVGSELV